MRGLLRDYEPNLHVDVWTFVLSSSSDPLGIQTVLQ